MSIWRPIMRGIAGGCVLLALGGCMTVGPDYGGVVAPELTPEYSTLIVPGNHGPSRPPVASTPISWQALDDGILQGLIARALRDNPSVDEVAWRIREAQQVVRIVSGQAQPFADFISGYEQRKRSGNSQPFVLSNGRPFNFFSVGLNSRWELDLVGRIARETEAATADADAAAEDFADVRRVLAGEIARAYVQLRLGQELLRQNTINLQLQKSSAEEVHVRIEAGKVSRLDLVQLNSRVSLTESESPIFEQAIRQNLNLIALLAGGVPDGSFRYLLEPLRQLRVPLFRPEVPANLLRRRPDVRRAEREVAAACARVGVAEAEFYPRLNILGTISFDSRRLSNLLDYDSLAFTVGPGITWNFLSLGRIEAQVEVQRAQLQQAIARYRQTVLLAVSEVENALAAQEQQRQRIGVLRRATREAREAVSLARDQYKADRASLERIVSNQQRLLQASLALAQSRAEAATAAINLNQALGGSGLNLAWRSCGTNR